MRRERVPSHAFQLLNKREEIQKLFGRQRRDPRSPTLLKGERKYLSALAIECKRQHEEALSKDLNDIKQEYVRARKLHAGHSKFQPAAVRRKKIVISF